MESNNLLIWIDLEMSGLDPSKDVILEIATIVTDHNLNIIEKGPNLAINQNESILDAMDEWNKEHHSKSGLINLVRASTVNELEAQETTLKFLSKHLKHKQSPMCGNTIYHDRAFIKKYMPHLEAFFHYRHIDVSSIKELARRWRPDLYDSFKKASPHRAQEDIIESIEELKFYRSKFFVLE